MMFALRFVALVIASAATAAGNGVAPNCKPMPALLHAEQPKYPDRESRVAVQGSVTLRFTIEIDGSVSDPVVEANDPVDTADWFNAPAREAIVRFKYPPVKAACRGRTKIVFKMDHQAGTPNKSLERTREG
jgi:TonB family protein